MTGLYLTKAMVDAALLKMRLYPSEIEHFQKVFEEAFGTNDRLPASKIDAVIQKALEHYDHDGQQNMPDISAEKIAYLSIPKVSTADPMTAEQAKKEIELSRLPPDFKRAAGEAIDELSGDFTRGQAFDAVVKRLNGTYNAEALQADLPDELFRLDLRL